MSRGVGGGSGKFFLVTAGPNDERQWAIEKGVVDGTKVTFQVQQPDGPLRKCALIDRDGQTVATVKVDIGRQVHTTALAYSDLSISTGSMIDARRAGR